MADPRFAGKRVLVGGATGYLGSRVVAELARAGARVRALVRPGKTVAEAAEHFEARATERDTLRGACEGMEWVFSALGVTRQRDGVTHDAVDYRANVSLLAEAERAGVGRFGVISVVAAERFAGNAMIDAKLRFLDVLGRSRLAPRVVAATGFFRDMAEILTMAEKGTVYLFGDGAALCNLVDGSDVARAALEALAGEQSHVDVGGPDVLSWNAIAELAFEALGRPARCRHVPVWILCCVLPAIRLFARNTAAELDFFARVSTSDLVAPRRGERTLAAYFRDLAPLDPVPARS